MCGRFTNRLTWREIVALYRLTVPATGLSAKAANSKHSGLAPKENPGYCPGFPYTDLFAELLSPKAPSQIKANFDNVRVFFDIGDGSP